MVECAIDDSDVAVRVVNRVVLEQNFVGNERNRGVSQGVGRVERLDADRSAGSGIAREVDVVQWTVKSQISSHLQVDVAHKTAAKTLQKLSASLVRRDEQFQFVVLRRNIAVHEGVHGEKTHLQDARRERSNRVVGDSVDVDLLRLVVQPSRRAERSHSSVFKVEIGHTEFRSGLWRTEKVGDEGFSRRQTAEFHGIEIDKVEDVFDINILQFGDERVGGGRGRPTVDDEVLVVARNGEMVDGEVVFAIYNRARLDRPKRVANREVRRVNIDVGSVFSVGRLEELRVGVQHALHRAQRVVFKVERGGEMVVGSVGVERQPQLVSVVGYAADGGVRAQGVVGRRDVQNGIAILAVVVDEMRQSGFEVHLAVAVVDLPFQMHRLAQRERDFKEIFEPFAVGDIRADAEIVANRLRLLRQTGQSREFAAHEVRETLGEGFVIVLPFDLDIRKIALEAQTATVARVRSR